MPRRGYRNIKDSEVRRALQTLSLADLLDVSGADPSHSDIIAYNTTTKRWEIRPAFAVGAAAGHDVHYTLLAGAAIAI